MSEGAVKFLGHHLVGTDALFPRLSWVGSMIAILYPEVRPERIGHFIDPRSQILHSLA